MVQMLITDNQSKQLREDRGPYGKADEMLQTYGGPKKPDYVGKTETGG